MRLLHNTAQVVYFIRAGDGPIKIGIACDLDRRLREIQIHHFDELRVVATVGGGMKLERELHKRFAAHHIRGEWFAPHPDILAEIERLT